MRFFKNWLSDNWPIVIVCIFAAGVLTYHLGKPFWGHHDWNGVYWGNIARNYVRYGLVETKFGMVENVGVTSSDRFGYVFHYSPLVPIIWSFFWKILGINEWSARLMAIIFSVGTLFVYYFLVKHFSNRRAAVISCFLWLATPMFLYFGKMPVHEVLVLFFVVSAFYVFFTRHYLLTCILIVLAELTSWPGYFIVPSLSVYWFLNRKNTSIWKIVIFWLISFVVFLSLLVHNQILTGDFLGGGLREIFFQRIRNVELSEYLRVLIQWLITYYTPLLIFVCAVGMIYVFLKRRKLFIPLIALSIFAVIYPVIFRDASFRHDYLLIYFLPFISFAGALGIYGLNVPRSLMNLFAALIVLAMVFIRRDFTSALITSNIYRESVKIGQYVNANSKPDEKVQIMIDPRIEGIDGWFISFYADREVSVVRDPSASLLKDKFILIRQPTD